MTAALVLMGHPLTFGMERSSSLPTVPGFLRLRPEPGSCLPQGSDSGFLGFTLQPGPPLPGPAPVNRESKRTSDGRGQNRLAGFRLALGQAIRAGLDQPPTVLSDQGRAEMEAALRCLEDADQAKLLALSLNMKFNCEPFVAFGTRGLGQFASALHKHCRQKGIKASTVKKKADLLALALRSDVQFDFEPFLLPSPSQHLKGAGGGGAGPEPGPRGPALLSADLPRPCQGNLPGAVPTVPVPGLPTGLMVPFHSFVRRRPGGGFVLNPTAELTKALRDDLDGGRIPSEDPFDRVRPGCFQPFHLNAKAAAMAERILCTAARFDEGLGAFEGAGSAFSQELKRDAYFNELYEDAVGLKAAGGSTEAPKPRAPGSMGMPPPLPRPPRPQG